MEHEKDLEFRSSSFWGFRTSDVSNEKNRSGGGSVDPYNLTSDEVLSLILLFVDGWRPWQKQILAGPTKLNPTKNKVIPFYERATPLKINMEPRNGGL